MSQIAECGLESASVEICAPHLLTSHHRSGAERGLFAYLVRALTASISSIEQVEMRKGKDIFLPSRIQPILHHSPLFHRFYRSSWIHESAALIPSFISLSLSAASSRACQCHGFGYLVCLHVASARGTRTFDLAKSSNIRELVHR